MNDLTAVGPAMREAERPVSEARQHRTPRFGMLLAASVLLPALILGAAGWSAWGSTNAEADRELAIAADAAAAYTQRVIDRHARAGMRIAERLGGAEDPAVLSTNLAVRERIDDVIADLPLLREVVVTGSAGTILVHANGTPGAEPRALSAAPPPVAASGDGEVMTTAAFRPRDAAAPSFRIVVPRGPGLGTVALGLDSNQMGADLRRMVAHADVSAALVRADGQILARSPPFRDPPPPLGADRPLVAAIAAGQVAGALEGTTPRDGRPVMVRFQLLANLPRLAVAVALPRAELVARWWEKMIPLFAIGLPAMVALVGLAWVARRQQQALELAMAGLADRVAERTASLQEGQERLRLAVESGLFGTWETDLRTGLTTRTAHAIDILGLRPDETTTPVEEWGARIHQADRARVLRDWTATTAGTLASYRQEYRYRCPDGTWRWLESTGAAVRHDPASRKPVRIAGMVRDITERREAEERRELLTQEVNHRARNTLAIVQAILRLTRAENAADFARLVDGRVAALARAQSLLAAERWTGAPIMAVLGEELAPFGGPNGQGGAAGDRFTLEGPPLRLRAEAVQPLGMVFHELATNAAKHGALSVPGGRVRVAWRVDEAAGMVRIQWTETGGPRPAGLPKHRGVGSRVIEATMSGQLAGTVERRWPSEGLICDLTIPVGELRAGPA